MVERDPNAVLTVKQAWEQSPGPKTPRGMFLLLLKGMCMGVADIIPGVSGGTMAFITGIYDNLIDAIRSFDTRLLRNLLRFDIPGVLSHGHFKFLAPLLLGIGIAILTMARVVHVLLKTHPIELWALFFGLIAASILVVGRKVEKWDAQAVLFTAIGAAASFLLVGAIPVTTPETWWFIILSGMIAICAMILPGISGAFLLLLLGKYEFVTSALRNPLAPESLAIIGLFGVGCLVGITGFSRILSWCLHHYHRLTVCLLTGFMLGAMRKIWPWKEVIEAKVIRGKLHVLATENILPSEYGLEFCMALGLAIVGFAVVVLIESISTKRS